MPRRVVAHGPSCIECRRRKIRCDRASPCGYCVKINEPCRYASPPAIQPQPQSDIFGVGGRLKRLEEEQAMQKDTIAKLQHSLETSKQTAAPAPPQDSLYFLFTAPTPQQRLLPDESLVRTAWRVFREKVHPAIKMVHLDAAEEAMRSPADSASTCLVLSVCYASVAALSPSECLHEFRQPQDQLLSRYVPRFTAFLTQ